MLLACCLLHATDSLPGSHCTCNSCEQPSSVIDFEDVNLFVCLCLSGSVSFCSVVIENSSSGCYSDLICCAIGRYLGHYGSDAMEVFD